MKVHFISGYYSDIAHKTIQARPPAYWDARGFVLGVKIGTHKYDFTIHGKTQKLNITSANFNQARKIFGGFINARLIDEHCPAETLLIPVPSKDGILGTTTYRSLTMLQDALSGTINAANVVSGIRWTCQLPKSHESGPQDRSFWRPYMQVTANVAGKNVVLIDDVITTGGTLLAAKECLEEAGATVLGAICCGKTVYDLKTAAFGKQFVILENELHDFCG